MNLNMPSTQVADQVEAKALETLMEALQSGETIQFRAQVAMSFLHARALVESRHLTAFMDVKQTEAEPSKI